jgi:LysR family glycine cleavage system transcriptional activator
VKRKLPPLNSLKAFEAAGQTGSFTQAGEQLNVTQSAVSRQVKLLEDLLGNQLLERKHHQLILTEAGRLLLPVLRQSFDQIDFVLRGIKEQQTINKLTLNVPPTFAHRWLIPRLSKLKHQYPDLDLTITTNSHDTLSSSSELHCAIRFGDGQWDDVESEMLLQECHIPVCSPTLLASNPKLKHSLNDATILYVLKNNKRFQTWKHWLMAANIDNIHNSNSIEFDTLNLAVRSAMFNLGVTMADKNMITHELSAGHLVQLMETELMGTQSYWLVIRTGQSEHANIAIFRQWLKQEIILSNPALTIE